MKTQPYYQSILNHITQEIYTGKLTVGSQLDSVKAMAERYATGENTIRTAVKRLEEKGFIETKRGKLPVVISISGKPEQALEWMSSRAGVILDLYDLICLIFPSIAVHSLQNFTSEDLLELSGIVENLKQGADDIPCFWEQHAHFIGKLISRADNSLIRELFPRVRDSIILPRMSDELEHSAEKYLAPVRQMFIQRAQNLVRYTAEKQFEFAKLDLLSLYTEIRSTILAMMTSITYDNGYSISYATPFHQEHYLYDLIVSDIIDQIYSGTYGFGDYLPSVVTMTRQYQVSLPTVRNACNLLNQLGIAKTANGKGTQLCLYAEYPDDFCKTLDGIVRVCKLREAMDFITVTVEDVTAHIAQGLRLEDVLALETELRQLRSSRPNHKFYPAFLLLGKLIRQLDCCAAQSIYTELKKSLLFGLYFERFRPEHTGKLIDEHYIACLTALEELKCGNYREFARLFAEIFHKMKSQSFYFFRKSGFTL